MELNINNFKAGVAQSPLEGFANMRNCSANHQGMLEVNNASLKMSPPAVTGAFTANAGTDVITHSSITFGYTSGTSSIAGIGRPVTLTTTGTLPAGLATGTVYYVIYVSNTTSKLASSYANAVAGTGIDITDAGTGTHTITSVDVGAVYNWAYDSANDDYYLIDHNKRVWKLDGLDSELQLMAGNTLTNGNGRGIAVWKGYVFAFRNAKIDVMKISDGTWTNDWQTLNTGASTNNSHHVIVFDDQTFFCDGRYIGTIRENNSKTFNPSDASTYTYNNQALNLPAEEISQQLGNIGKYLAIGTDYGKVYRWDFHASATSYERPVKLREKNVWAMININGYLYVFYGNRGACAITNGTDTEEAFMLSDYLTKYSELVNKYIQIGGCAVCNNKLIFSARLSTGGNGMAGIYSWDLTDKSIVLENTTSGDYTSATTTNQYLHSIISDGISYVYSWQNNPVSSIEYYLDIVSPSHQTKYQAYEAYAESAIYTVGTAINTKTLNSLFISPGRELSNGHAIRISYRTNLNDAYTTIATITYATHGAVSTIEVPAGMIYDAEKVQFKVELSDSTNLSTPLRLISIKVT